MKPGPFRYLAPESLQAAAAALREHADAKVLAGGQSLIPVLSMRLARPSHLVDLGGIPGLDRIEVSEACVRVGAMVRHAQLLADEAAYAALPLLRQALVNVAHPAIRNRGTTVGSIAHADAAGEMPSVLAITDGVVEAIGPDGRREIAAADFFAGALETTLAHDEIVEAVRFGRFPSGTRTAFLESARRKGDYALAGVAVAVTVGDDGRVTTAKASFVSVTDVPGVVDLTGALAEAGLARVDLAGAEAASADAASGDAARGDAAGADLSTANWSAIEETVRAHLQPESDIHASADYRRMLAVELTKRALAQALDGDGTEPSIASATGARR